MDRPENQSQGRRMEPAVRITTTTPATRGVLLAVTSIALLLTVAATAPAMSSQARTGIAAYVPPVKHVFVINLENKGYDRTWGPGSAAPYPVSYTHLRAHETVLDL